ncbi:hypothetical protein [Candidatus Nitrosacidococcus sp. I8]|uniref:hypothetical protein n=1 Tax=Candidatus Nitrosacidococcus sp. I8 TaxID=2942908 RepID=UPI0022261221|nr:hypothetical protein [Candidatus Nitrosacidococcus sp. I8]CAH9016966.1 hypothetical protein NURINAE_00270 [Candidatus Nitrosacidococcus sp. I8]
MKTLTFFLIKFCIYTSFLFTVAVLAAPLSLNINYYTISKNDPDANHLSSGVVDNEVQAHLGEHGLPVLNTPEFGCTSNCFSLLNGPSNLLPSGEITYWAPDFNEYVTQTGSGVVELPFDKTSFFPPNGTGDSDFNGFQAAKLFGDLIVPDGVSESISFTVGADDMAFVYLDGNIVCDLGGIHALSPGTCISSEIGAGTHTLDVFYTDINISQAGLNFGINTNNITVTPTPNPGTFMLLGSGLIIFSFFPIRKNFSTNHTSAYY